MSLFKKLLGNQDGATGQRNTPTGLQTMGVQLQRKFARGVQYNMKIVIRGDRNVGKTCLFHRLQGQKFKEEYIPTEEIQVANIQWNYKTTDDVVKVEIWDVVDKGKKKKKSDGLKLDTNSKESPEEPCLDAEFMDVYKGCNGVILIYDITKQWTYTYIEREVERVPEHIPILVLGNHRDMGHHRTVTEDKARYFCLHYERPEGSAQIRYAESSMCNGFGLRYIHKFFNLPYLQLQRESLLKQLEVNTVDMNSTLEELDIHEESEEQNYDVFIDNLSTKRRQQQEKNSGNAVSNSDLKQEVVAEKTVKVPKSLSMPALQQTAISPKTETKTPTVQEVTPPIISPSENTAKSSPDVPAAKPVSKPPEPEQKQGFFSRLFKSKEQPVEKKESKEEKVEDVPVTSVDEFIPDGGAIDASFLDDAKEPKDTGKVKNTEDSDSEEEGNPMVAGFQDDLDSEDDFVPNQVASDDSDLDQDNGKNTQHAKINRTLSSDSEKKHSSDKDSNINVIHSDDSDQDIPVTKDQSLSDVEQEVEKKQVAMTMDDSDIEENVNSPVVMVAADDSDIEENINSPVVMVAADVSDVDEDDVRPSVTVDENISDNESEDKVVNNENVNEINNDQVVNGDSTIAQQPDFGNWLDELESKSYKAPEKTSHSSKVKEKIDVSGTDAIKKKKKKKKEDSGEGEKKKSSKKKDKDKDKPKREKKKKKKDTDDEDLENFLNDVPPQSSAGYESL